MRVPTAGDQRPSHGAMAGPARSSPKKRSNRGIRGKNGTIPRISCIPRSSGLSILAALHNFLPPSVKKARKGLTTDFTDGTDGGSDKTTRLQDWCEGGRGESEKLKN